MRALIGRILLWFSHHALGCGECSDQCPEHGEPALTSSPA